MRTSRHGNLSQRAWVKQLQQPSIFFKISRSSIASASPSSSHLSNGTYADTYSARAVELTDSEGGSVVCGLAAGYQLGGGVPAARFRNPRDVHRDAGGVAHVVALGASVLFGSAPVRVPGRCFYVTPFSVFVPFLAPFRVPFLPGRILYLRSKGGDEDG